MLPSDVHGDLNAAEMREVILSVPLLFQQWNAWSAVRLKHTCVAV